MKKAFGIVSVAIAMLMSLFALAAPAASASEPPPPPAVELSNMTYGQALYSASGSGAAAASLKASSGAKVYLNVQVSPMTRSQIKPGSCKRAKVGSWMDNEMVDPATGKHWYKHMRVQAGDNLMCKDRRGVLRKASCGNRVRGLFGIARAPRSLLRANAVIQDYLVFRGGVSVSASQTGQAHAYVVQFSNGQKVCESDASVNGTGTAKASAYVSVRSRTVASMRVTAARSARLRASTMTSVKGDLKTSVNVSLNGKAMAMCNYTPPPPAHDECTNIPGDQPEGYVCYPPPSYNCPPGTTWEDKDHDGKQEQGECMTPPPATPPVVVDITRPNDTNPGWTTPACATADFPQGHSGKLYFSFESGTVKGTNPVQVNDMQQGCVTLVSPTEEGWYTFKVTATDSVTGLSVTKESQAYHVFATPPPA